MKRKKDERAWVVDADPFTSTAIKDGGIYEIIVLAAGQVVERAEARGTNKLSSVLDDPTENRYVMYNHDGSTVSLLSRSYINLPEPPKNASWDVLIKAPDGTTIVALINVPMERRDQPRN